MPPAQVISFDEMWTCVGARRREKRREVWIWTAVVEEADGRRWSCFEAGDRSEETFSRLLSQLPEAGRYRSDDYVVYGLLPRNRHVANCVSFQPVIRRPFRVRWASYRVL